MLNNFNTSTCMANERFTRVPGELIDVQFKCINPLSTVGICPAFPVTFNFTAYTPRYERISDSANGNRRSWNDFEHFKSVQGDPSPNGGATVCSESSGLYPLDHAMGNCPHIACGYDRWIGFNFSQPFGDVGSLDKDLPSFVSSLPDGKFISPPASYDELMQRALGTILPLIKAELSLPNFIYELKDFKRPIAQAVRVFRSSSFLAALTKLGLTSKQLRRLTFSRMLQGSAGSYLNYSFNIKPLITDIAKLTSAMARTERRLNDFITREGRPQNRHYVFSWAEFADSTDQSTGGTPGALSPFDGTSVSSERTVSYDPSVFHVQVQYNYNYTGYQREHALLLSRLDGLGINLNPKIIWDALPWSFVVDWVFGIGQWLDQFRVTNMEPVINIHRALWSIRRSRSISVVKRTGYSRVPNSVITQNRLPNVRQTAYRRSVFVPAISSILSSGLSLKETSLGAALVIARKRR